MDEKRNRERKRKRERRRRMNLKEENKCFLNLTPFTRSRISLGFSERAAFMLLASLSRLARDR